MRRSEGASEGSRERASSVVSSALVVGFGEGSCRCRRSGDEVGP